jgi:mono/diheme cytochrome c family protein
MAGCWKTLILGGGLLCSLSVLLGQTGQESRTDSENHPASADFVLPQKHKSPLTPAEQKGQALYEYYCALCHGETGQGDGFNSFNLTIPPAKLADATRMAGRSDAQMQEIIKKGGPALGLSPLMPPWGGVLTDKQVSDLTAFVRTLAR